jgi:tRNA nucleotidyltransferase (CCA-adding enzyme)
VLHLVTARSETYPAPGALPVVQPASVEKDLERRDFSINAMAVRLDDEHRYELLDPLGGEADLRHGVIRVLHEKSFIDDPTRMYRAVRYELRLGFVQDAATLGYIDRGRSYVEQVSGERIRHELDMILGEPDPGAMIARLDELDLLRSIHAALDWNQGAQSRIDRTKSPEPPDEPQASEVDIRWILWLMGVPAGTVPSLADRLAFTGRLQQALRVAIELRDHTSRLGAMKPSQIAAVLREKPELAIRALALAAPVAQVNNAFDSYLTAWREVKPVTTGEDLKALGLSPGPIYSQIIERLRAAWIDGEVATAEAERGLLATLLEQQSHTGALDAI